MVNHDYPIIFWLAWFITTATYSSDGSTAAAHDERSAITTVNWDAYITYLCFFMTTTDWSCKLHNYHLYDNHSLISHSYIAKLSHCSFPSFPLVTFSGVPGWRWPWASWPCDMSCWIPRRIRRRPPCDSETAETPVLGWWDVNGWDFGKSRGFICN